MELKQDALGHLAWLDGPDPILHLEIAGGVDCDNAKMSAIGEHHAVRLQPVFQNHLVVILLIGAPAERLAITGAPNGPRVYDCESGLSAHPYRQRPALLR